MIYLLPFESLPSFIDPQQIIKDENGNDIPYGLFRYDQIIQECYLISKNINTSYLDLMEITPKERNKMLDFLTDEAKRNQELMDKERAKMKKH